MKNNGTKHVLGGNFILTSMTRKELAELYSVTRRTLFTWFEIHGIKCERVLLTPDILEEIFEKIGIPGKLLELVKNSKND